MCTFIFFINLHWFKVIINILFIWQTFICRTFFMSPPIELKFGSLKKHVTHTSKTKFLATQVDFSFFGEFLEMVKTAHCYQFFTEIINLEMKFWKLVYILMLIPPPNQLQPLSKRSEASRKRWFFSSGRFQCAGEKSNFAEGSRSLQKWSQSTRGINFRR